MNVLVVIPVNEKHKEKLEAAGGNCSFTYSSYQAVTVEQVQNADIIIGNVSVDMINASPRLKFLQLNSAGADGYILPGKLDGNTILSNATGAYSKAVAEHCFAMLFALQKKLHLYRDKQKQHEWTDLGQITSFTDYTVLVMGLGDIGLHFARLCKAMGSKTIGIKRRESDTPDGVDELYLSDKLMEVLPRVDAVASFLPGNDATRHIFTIEHFKNMRDTAFFINGGRGSAVASDVLYEAVSTGMIAGAGIDVTEPEPLPADSPLWDLDNVFITPHISGQFHLQETFERIVDIAAKNLERFINGKKPTNIVDFNTGYKL